MKGAGSGRSGGRAALAGIASFFRQLSLFDAVPTLTLTAPEKPVSPQPASPCFQPSFAELCRGPYAHIQVIPKKRLWESWRVAWTRRNEALRLDIPAILEEAPGKIKESVLEWSVLVTRRGSKRDPALRARRAELESLVRDHLRAPSNAAPSRIAERRLAQNRRKLERLRTRGTHHDLEAAFRAVNARYFQGELHARVTWSARLGGLSTHSLAQDGDGKTYHLISISRGYDNPDVTPEILGGVVYHECLHIAIPPRSEGGRRVVHGPDFRKREREYEHFEVWRKWHREGLPRAVRQQRRSKIESR